MTQMFPKPVKRVESQLEKVKRYRAKALKKLVGARKRPGKRKRVRLPKLSTLMRKADSLFSQFIRARDKKCVLCGTVKNLTAGHLIKRGKKSVRFDENNVNCLCSGCNYKDNFEHDLYVSWWLREYGTTPYQDLVDRSKVLQKVSREWLNEIIAKYDTTNLDSRTDKR